jgi:hypothetical protein
MSVKSSLRSRYVQIAASYVLMLSCQGFVEEDFQLLSSITSWSTCGSGRPRGKLEDTEEPPQELHSPVEASPPPEGEAVEVEGRRVRDNKIDNRDR